MLSGVMRFPETPIDLLNVNITPAWYCYCCLENQMVFLPFTLIFFSFFWDHILFGFHSNTTYTHTTNVYTINTILNTYIHALLQVKTQTNINYIISLVLFREFYIFPLIKML